MNVTVQHLTKRFGKTTVVNNVSLEIADGELFFLLGPSGSGKTTLLRLLAGFYQPDEGEIRFGDRLMNNVAPNRRNTGMVFQNYALWPHLSVFENVAYGLDVRGIRGAERIRRVEEALAIVQMRGYAQRSPAELSGGQQQRIALARALVIRPDVLLLDEPLSNLDAKLRSEMREEIRRIHRETKLTTLYVTHDQQEALALADRIAVMRDGIIEQVGSPLQLYRNPRGDFVREFLGAAHLIEADVVAVLDEQRVRIRTPLGEMECAASAQPGDRVTCAIRPNDVIALRG